MTDLEDHFAEDQEFLVSRTFHEWWWEEEDDDYPEEETGFVFEEEVMDIDDLLSELRDMSELSVAPAIEKNITGHVWANQEASQDPHTGVTRQESVHIKYPDGRPLSNRDAFLIFKESGLAK